MIFLGLLVIILILALFLFGIGSYIYWCRNIEIKESEKNNTSIIQLKTYSINKYNDAVANYASEGYEIISEQPKTHGNYMISCVMTKEKS